MRNTLRLSMLQMTSHTSHAVNIVTVQEASAQAAHDGADLLALPEAAGLLNLDRETAVRDVTNAARDPFIAACQEAARAHGIWIQMGSTPVTGPGDKFLNHGVLIDPEGQIVAEYDKIHLFDVHLEGKPPTGESRRYAAGETGVVVDTPWGPWGLSICYDLRFPGLYRDYAQAGATVVFVPSAFTVRTGRAHWEVLLRARAIENGAWVVAAAQVGKHADGRRTYGHSLVISPWGEVVADMGGEAPGQVTVDLDMGAVAKARGQIPSLENGRPYRMQLIGTKTLTPG